MIYGLAATIGYTAWDTAANAPKTGDASNHTLRLLRDGALVVPTNTPVELDATNCPGEYALALTDTETQAHSIESVGKSDTADVALFGRGYSFYRLPLVAPGAHNGLPLVDANGLVPADAVRLAGTAAVTALHNSSVGAVIGDVGGDLRGRVAGTGSVVLLSDGTGTGQVLLSSGVVAADAVKVVGDADYAIALASLAGNHEPIAELVGIGLEMVGNSDGWQFLPHALAAAPRTPRLLIGSGPPVAIGADGDQYIDGETGDVYGPKTDGEWGAVVTNVHERLAASASAVLATTGATLATVTHVDHGNAALRARGDAAWTTATGFSTLTENQVEQIVAGTEVNVADKTGFKLSPDGLDQISIADPGGIAEYDTWPKLLVGLFRWIFSKTKNDKVSKRITVYADNGTTANLVMDYDTSGGVVTKEAAE